MIRSTSERNAAEVFVALGSNLGDRHAMIRDALAALNACNGVQVDAVSELIETEPLGPPDQPMYVNAVARLWCEISPRELLNACLRIEKNLGRNRKDSQRWGPRIIDLDILMFADLVVDAPGLTIPHPHMHERRFVLEPLARIAPHAAHPVLKASIASLLQRLEIAAAKR